MNLRSSFEASLLLVCVWGLLAILLTGQFSAIITVASILMLIVSYRLRRNGWKPSQLAANIAAGVVLMVSAVTFFSTLNLLSTTVYLFVFLQVTKYLTRQNHTESRWCYLISLFHIVGASVITTTLTFGIMLVVYIFLMLTSLRLYVIVRGLPPAGAPNPPVLARVPRRLVNSALPLSVFIIGLSGMLFSIIPRLATQNLFQAYGPPPDEPATSAFSESVEFGSFTSIQLNDAIAMYVEPQGKRPDHVRMRAVALDNFDGKTWKRTNYVFLRSGTYDFKPAFTTRMYNSIYRYRVLQPVGVTNYFFGDSFPLSMKIPNRLNYLVDPMAQAVYMADMLPKEFQYEIESMHEDLSTRLDPSTNDLIHRSRSDLLHSQRNFPADDSGTQQSFSSEFDRFILRMTRAGHEGDGDETSATQDELDITDGNRARPDDARSSLQREIISGHNAAPDDDDSTSPDTQAEIADNPIVRDWVDIQRRRHRPTTGQQRLHYYLWKCLQLPDELAQGRVPELAREWADGEDTTFTKAMEIERRLRRDFAYSLTPQASGNFIESFLLDVREGHCEYFATSMAVLLRNLGIPARIVNGYYATEWNGISSAFTVRQRDAHSWVEAWMGDDYGWMTFDPTPAAGVGRRNETSKLVLQLTSIMDAMKVRWYRYVVDYSFNDQVAAFRRVMSWRDNFMRYMDNFKIMGFGSSNLTQLEIDDLTTGIDWRPLMVALGIIVALVSWQVYRWIIRRKRNSLTPVKFYNELLMLLANHNIRIKPGQTPREFAREVAGMSDQWRVFIDLTEFYYARRYYAGSAAETRHLRESLSNLKRDLRKRHKK